MTHPVFSSASEVKMAILQNRSRTILALGLSTQQICLNSVLQLSAALFPATPMMLRISYWSHAHADLTKTRIKTKTYGIIWNRWHMRRLNVGMWTTKGSHGQPWEWPVIMNFFGTFLFYAPYELIEIPSERHYSVKTKGDKTKQTNVFFLQTKSPPLLRSSKSLRSFRCTSNM